MKNLLLLATASVLSVVNGCIYPTGLGNGVGEVDPATLTLPPDGIFAASILQIIPFLSQYETPIQFRLIQLSNIAIFSSMSSFEETSLDHFARIPESTARRRCNDIDPNDFDLYRRVTLAYTLYFTLSTFVPESESMRLSV